MVLDIELLPAISILHHLLGTNTAAYAQHRAALAASPPARSAIAALLLKHALPHLAAVAEGQGMDWRSCSGLGCLLDTLTSAVGSASLMPALQRHISLPGSAAFFQHAARVVKAVPLEVPEGVPAQQHAAAHRNAAKLLSDLCLLLTSAAGQPGSRAAATSTAPGRAELQAAGWQVVGLVPHMAAAIQGMAAGTSRKLQQMLPAICYSFATAVQCQDMWSTSIGSQQQLEVWVAAADAGMRLLPLLRQLDASWHQRQDLRDDFQIVALMAARLVLRMLHVGSIGACKWALRPGSEPAACVRASLAAPLAQLHSRSCRLVHWLLAGGHRAMMPGGGSAADWDVLQELLCRQLDIAAGLSQEEEDSSQDRHARWAHKCHALHVSH